MVQQIQCIIGSILLLYRAHYPGTKSDDNAVKTGKPLWASEDYSTFNDEEGTGCWARVSNVYHK